ncbi:uncharacterized protein HMPREF1541_00168 [Cyphellophora europaea CBS 101466]|uniref:Uncharacterized protein n=1 Tax=Cyphellophora europaea (strain CBS 101466) TaxID=1220924 RepID=W2SB82_CYPE1|nr:uncharacterized protein HMPREF1541_00168 [Cyphellophora europaea CBS 101466]ETN45986.1 hypothetical protein HMPREF1541_00168 [Cyphellophora europaea CBS 101466]
MESPLTPLSRTPSTHSIYAPGSHRRSHPNLSHLSLAPLTPRYPIDPADYLAYTDPTTSTLHTSASISHIASLPSPGGILSNTSPTTPRSRATSRTRLKRKAKSHVSVVLPQTQTEGDAGGLLQPSSLVPSGAVSSAGYGHSVLRAAAQQPKTSKSHTHLSRLSVKRDASWLVHTGLALTESGRESKGQSWLGKRDSSTSLAALSTVSVSVLGSPSEERREGFVRSGRQTPGGGSRPVSRSRRSRKELAMTSVAVLAGDGAYASGIDGVEPDWADKETQAELAANEVGWDGEVLREEEAEDDEEDEDPYGELNFDGHFDTESDILDEEEVRRELNKGGLGKWIEGVVDVFLMLEDDVPEDFDAESRQGLEQSRTLAGESARRGPSEDQQEDVKPAWDDGREEQDIEPPPQQPQGMWDDVRWLSNVVVRNLWS